MATHKGLFKPRNPAKYNGNPNTIRYLSWWEFRYMQYLDKETSVRTWASEEFFLHYFRADTGRIAKYYPDFFVEYIDGSKEIIEIKPLRETQPPKQSPNKKRKTLIREAITYETNQSKFAAARAFCSKNNMKFRIITEIELKRMKLI